MEFTTAETTYHQDPVQFCAVVVTVPGETFGVCLQSSSVEELADYARLLMLEILNNGKMTMTNDYLALETLNILSKMPMPL